MSDGDDAAKRHHAGWDTYAVVALECAVAAAGGYGLAMDATQWVAGVCIAVALIFLLVNVHQIAKLSFLRGQGDELRRCHGAHVFNVSGTIISDDEPADRARAGREVRALVDEDSRCFGRAGEEE